MKIEQKTFLSRIFSILALVITGQAFAAGYTTTYQYNDTTGQTAITDPSGHKVTETFRRFGSPNDTGQLTTIEQQNNKAGAPSHFDQQTLINQDVAGHVLNIIQKEGITNKSLTRTYHYDNHWFLTSEDNPETGTTTFGRDAIGQKTSTKVGHSGTTHYTYDADGNLLTTAWPDKSQVANTYDANNQLLTTTKTAAKATDKNIWTYTYDVNGHILTSALAMQDNQPFTGAFKYAYNSAGNLSTLTYPDGTAINYAPNALGQTTKVGRFVPTIKYYPSGKVNRFTDANGEVTTYTLNDRLMDSDITVGKSGHLIINRHYDYDNVGNTTAITDKLQPANNKTFTFDHMNELTGETWQGQTLHINYDAFGNIISRSNNQSTTLHYTYSPANNLLTHLIGEVSSEKGSVNLNQTFTYDPYGDITGMTQSGGVTETFAYDDQSRLTAVSGKGLLNHQPVNVTHIYDGNGDQLTTTTTDAKGNKTTDLTLYGANSQLLYKENLTKKTAMDYYSLNGHIIAKTKHAIGHPATATEAIYLHDDLLGSPLQQTNASGAAQWKQPQDYSPYGLERKVPTQGVHVGFTGKLNNSDTGISDFGARAYNPLLGRFMQQDPEAVHDDKPFTFNRYAYANNNPLAYKDPKGDLPDWVEQAVGAGTGAAVGFMDAQSAGMSLKESFIMTAFGAEAGLTASLVSAALSAEAAETVVNMNIAARVAFQAAADTGGNVVGGLYGSAATGQLKSKQDFENTIISNLVPAPKGVDAVFGNIEGGMVKNTFHVGLSVGEKSPVGHAVDQALNRGSHSDKKEKDRHNNFGLGQLGDLGLDNHSGDLGGCDHTGGAGSNRDPFDNSSLDPSDNSDWR